MAIDAVGGVVVTGKLWGGGMNFGGGQVNGRMFAVAFDSDANHIWSRAYGSGTEESSSSVSVGPFYRVVVGGTFTSLLELESGPLASAGWKDGFVISFDNQGAALWSASFGDDSVHPQFGNDAAVDSLGNVALVGSYGSGSPSEVGKYHAHIQKHNAAGTKLWQKSYGTDPSQSAGAYGVVFDAAGNVIVTGAYAGNVDFGGGALGPPGGSILVKLDPDGEHEWSKPVGGGRMAIDAAGNVVVAGGFSVPTDFGGGVLTPDPSGDIFVVKLDTNGSHIWSKAFGGTGGDYVNAISIDLAGNVLLTGKFYETLDFGGAPLEHVGVGANIFMAKLDGSGSHVFSLRTGSGYPTNEGWGIVADTHGDVVVTGVFHGVVDFGGAVLDTGSEIAMHMYLAKLPCGG